MNKRAIELSVNFIVIFILAMVMFGVGLYIMRQVFGEAVDMKEKIDESTRQQIENMLSQGTAKVIIPFQSIKVKAGKNDIVGIGIRNDLASAKNFYISTQCDAAYTSTDERICDADCGPLCDSWIGDTFDGPYLIEKNDRKIGQIMITVPKTVEKPGTYVFNAKVCHYPTTGAPPSSCLQEDQYDTTKKFYIEVSR